MCLNCGSWWLQYLECLNFLCLISISLLMLPMRLRVLLERVYLDFLQNLTGSQLLDWFTGGLLLKFTVSPNSFCRMVILNYFTLAVLSAFLEIPLVFIGLSLVSSKPVHLIVLELSSKLRSIRPNKNSMPMHEVIEMVALIDSPISPFISAWSIHFTFVPKSFIGITVALLKWILPTVVYRDSAFCLPDSSPHRKCHHSIFLCQSLPVSRWPIRLRIIRSSDKYKFRSRLIGRH